MTQNLKLIESLRFPQIDIMYLVTTHTVPSILEIGILYQEKIFLEHLHLFIGHSLGNHQEPDPTDSAGLFSKFAQ